MLIGVLSDTHLIDNRAGLIPKEVVQGFTGVDMIIHAGDFCIKSVLDELERIAPVRAAAGNMDNDELLRKLPRKQILDIKGYKIGVIHGDGGQREYTPQRVLDTFKDDNVDCIIFGHTHQAYNSLHEDVLLFNPGSSTEKRTHRYYSYGLLRLGETIEARIVYF